MTGKLKVVRTIKADNPDIKKLVEKYPGLLRVRYYQDQETGETFKTIEMRIEKDSI